MSIAELSCQCNYINIPAENKCTGKYLWTDVLYARHLSVAQFWIQKQPDRWYFQSLAMNAYLYLSLQVDCYA